MSSLFSKLRALVNAGLRGGPPSREPDQAEQQSGVSDSPPEVTEGGRDRDEIPEVTEAPLQRAAPAPSRNPREQIKDSRHIQQPPEPPGKDEESSGLEGSRVVDHLKEQDT
jgi:hypothetical protein